LKRMLQVLESAALWALVWTAVLYGIFLYQEYEKGESVRLLEPWNVVVMGVIWIIAFGFMLFYKVLRAAGGFDRGLGAALARNPRGSVGDALGKAADRAVQSVAPDRDHAP